MVNYMWAGIILTIIGLIATYKPDWLAPLFGWKEKLVGAKVTPPKNIATQYRILGIVFLVLGLILIYISR